MSFSMAAQALTFAWAFLLKVKLYTKKNSLFSNFSFPQSPPLFSSATNSPGTLQHPSQSRHMEYKIACERRKKKEHKC